jgi:septum formation topological specificity factor MinE
MVLQAKYVKIEADMTTVLQAKYVKIEADMTTGL